MNDLKNAKWIVLDNEGNKIAEGNDKSEIIRDIELFALLKTEYDVRLIKS